MKIFLITATVHMCGFEHSAYGLIRARKEETAQRRANALVKSDAQGFDKDGSYFGHSGESMTKLHDLIEITAEGAATLERLGMAYFI